MSRPVRFALGVLVAALAIIGFGIGYTLLVGGRPDIGNPDFATVKQRLPGTWRLQETSQADLVAGLVDEFGEADLRSQISDLGIGDPVRLSLTFTQDTISVSSVADGATAKIGSGTYRLIDNHTLFVTRGACQVRAQIRLHDDVLTFGIIDPCPTELSDITLAVLLRGAPFNKAAVQ
jgi:hypothetical protein